jgi:hypothetical protein
VSREQRDADLRRLHLRVLGFLLFHPLQVLFLAISTGMAIGQEMVMRGCLADLQRLGMNEVLCNRVCELVLRAWDDAGRVGSMTEAEFQRLLSQAIAIARSS